MTTTALDLLVERDGTALRLLAPAVGLFTRAQLAGCVFTPGQDAGTLLVLGLPHSLRVPSGTFGLIANARPERVYEPVGYGSLLYELRPLADASVEPEAELASGGEAGLVLRAPQTGRFYRRPGPDQPDFVSPGDSLVEGRPVGLIEVMKTFTHVPYRAGGTLPARARVVSLLAQDGADVQEGDPLIEVEPG